MPPTGNLFGDSFPALTAEPCVNRTKIYRKCELTRAR